MNLGIENIKANVTIETSVLLFPADIIEFAENWIIVKQADEDKNGNTTGVFYHIRKRTESDPSGAVIIDSLTN